MMRKTHQNKNKNNVLTLRLSCDIHSTQFLEKGKKMFDYTAQEAQEDLNEMLVRYKYGFYDKYKDIVVIFDKYKKKLPSVILEIVEEYNAKSRERQKVDSVLADFITDREYFKKNKAM